MDPASSTRYANQQLSTPHDAKDEAENRQDDGDPKDDFGTGHGRAGHSAKTQQRRDYGDDEENDGPVEQIRGVHVSLP